MHETQTPTRHVPLSDLNQLPLGELFSEIINARALESLIDLAIGEDTASQGDITTPLLVPEDAVAVGAVISRGEGVQAGGVLIERIARRVDPALKVDLQMADGGDLFPGNRIATLSGPLRSMLLAERTILNFVSHLCGVATLTARFVHAVTGEDTLIYDTRKTLPGLRRLEKYAVRCGGGYCHRIGLYDAVLIKDNHIRDIAPEQIPRVLGPVILRARALTPTPAFVEIEVDSLEQLRHVLECDVDIVLLDNMTPEDLARGVAMRDEVHPSVEIEASGGVTLANVSAVARTGVNRIAIGALTHSAPALDIGMDILSA